MKNILVAVDFSENSFSAFYYACQLTKELNSTLTVLHSVSLPMATDSGMLPVGYSMPYNEAKNHLDYFVDQLAKDKKIDLPKITIHKEVITGPAAFTLASYADENNVDLIIMGTIEKSNAFSRMIGSVTSATINEANCPVLLIHKNTRYKKPNKIVFAVDHKGDVEEYVEVFNKINNHLHAYTEFIHVKPMNKKSIQITKSELVHELVEQEETEYSFEIKEIDGNNPITDIIDYCVFSKADMLVMVHHEINFFRRIFQGSTSFKTAENIHLPVLIIPED